MLNRRRLLQHSGHLGLLTAGSTLLPLGLARRASAQNASDYRAMVCILLAGGNDSYNMLVPRSDAEYNAYANSRQNLAIAQQDLLPITPPGQGGVEFGLHPSMGGIQSLFEAGSAALVTNVGPLVEPTTKADFLNGSVTLPPQLFSHNDQQDQWTSLRGPVPSKTGWAGRMADLIRRAAEKPKNRIKTRVSLGQKRKRVEAKKQRGHLKALRGPVED